jgi:hypothetical protein
MALDKQVSLREPPLGRHGVLVQFRLLPPELQRMEALAAEGDRPLTRELRRAVRQYIAAHAGS